MTATMGSPSVVMVWVPETLSPSRDLGVFVDETAETVPSQDAGICARSGRILALGGRALVERPVGAMDVVVIDVLAQDQLQVSLAGDQHPVQALAPGAGYPSLRDRVRPWVWMPEEASPYATSAYSRMRPRRWSRRRTRMLLISTGG